MDFKRVRYFAVYLALVAGFLVMLAVFGWRTFELFGIGTIEPYFADLRVISGAIKSEDQGLAPWVSNPYDPLGRPLNYPRVWVTLFRLISLLGDPVPIFGLFQAGLLLALGGILSFRREGFLCPILLISPPFLLAFERGNNDILIFLMVLFGFWQFRIAGGAAIGLAAGLKLFPLAAVPVAVLLGARSRFMIGVAAGVPLIVWALMQLPIIGPILPNGGYAAFGIKSAWFPWYDGMKAVFGAGAIPKGFASVTTIFAMFFALALLLWLAFRSVYSNLCGEFLQLGDVVRRIAIGFLFLFIAIFLTGSNYAYKLMFLAPVLWGLAAIPSARLLSPARLLLIAGLALMFLPILPHGRLLLNPAGALYAALLTPLAVTIGLNACRQLALELGVRV